MNNITFKDQVCSSINNKKTASKPYAADFLLPNFYSYEKISEASHDVSNFLHLLGGGNLKAEAPFTFHFSPLSCALLLYTEWGGGRIISGNGAEYEITDHQICFLDCEQDFTLRSVMVPWAFKLFFIGGDNLSLFLPMIRHKETNCFSLTSISPVLDALRTLLSIRADPDISDLLRMHRSLTEILTLLCSACYPSTSDAPSGISWYLIEMKDFLDHHYQQDFSLKYFEEKFRINRYRLCREFSSCYGLPPLQYLTRKRLDEAKKILLTSDLSIHEISSMIGYENTNHFINLFKKYVTTTPGRFRQKAQPEQSVLRCPAPQFSQAT